MKLKIKPHILALIIFGGLMGVWVAVPPYSLIGQVLLWGTTGAAVLCAVVLLKQKITLWRREPRQASLAQFVGKR